jgi:hypothetical protein
VTKRPTDDRPIQFLDAIPRMAEAAPTGRHQPQADVRARQTDRTVLAFRPCSPLDSLGWSVMLSPRRSEALFPCSASLDQPCNAGVGRIGL